MSPFGLLLPLLCLVVLRRALTADRTEDSAVLIMALFTILWVAALTLLVDGAEANRMRFGVDALFIATSLAALSPPPRKHPEDGQTGSQPDPSE